MSPKKSWEDKVGHVFFRGLLTWGGRGGEMETHEVSSSAKGVASDKIKTKRTQRRFFIWKRIQEVADRKKHVPKFRTLDLDAKVIPLYVLCIMNMMMVEGWGNWK